MTLDDRLRQMAAALDARPGLLAIRRQYRRVEDEYQRRLSDPLARWVTDPAEPDDAEEREQRRFLSHAAAVTFGCPVSRWDGAELIHSMPGSRPYRKIGITDVREVESATRALRALNHTYGGSFCLDSVLHYLQEAERLFDALSTDIVRHRLLGAVADLHNLAGWMSFDVGDVKATRKYFARALELAREGRDSRLIANTLYRMGLVYLHGRAPVEALKLFQLGQVAAEMAGSEFVVGLLCAYEAWAYSRIGDFDQARKLLTRAGEEFERCRPSANESTSVSEQRFAQSLLGAVREELTHNSESQALALASQATFYLVGSAGNLGAQTGHEALDVIQQVKPVHIRGRLRLLRKETEKYIRPDVRHLSHRIDVVLRKVS